MSKGKAVVLAFVWITIVFFVGLAWKMLIVPHKEEEEKKAQAEAKKTVLVETSASSRYSHSIKYGLDSFSGYCIQRSDVFVNDLAGQRIKVDFVDDGANYDQRLLALKNGEIQLASFTVDALIKASDKLNEIPAVIIAVIDETRGADAAVAFKDAIPNIDALNDARVKFVVPSNTPSETLVRVILSHFNLDKLDKNPFVFMNDAEEVYKAFRKAKPEDKQVFVLWEPYVTKILDNPNTHVVVDSARLRGYIVDVIVANREYLKQNPQVVSSFMKSYLRAVYTHQKDMVGLVVSDAQKANSPLSQKQAERLVGGIWWKNTSENFSHFGLLNNNIQHIEDIVTNITNVLVTTGASGDPTKGRPNLMYYDGVLRELQSSGFHPGIEAEAVSLFSSLDNSVLPNLSEAEWAKLMPVGKLQVPQLVFARGTTILTDRSQSILDELVEKLKTWPQNYVMIRGNASLVGDLNANKALALERAKVAESYLINKGINPNRVRASAGDPSGETSVSFVLGQLPY